jgi:8-oxo-dGTP diphosphatase
MDMKKVYFIDVSAAIFRRNNFVLVARRAKGQYLEYKWEFPGGKIEKNESPEECLHRELKEEFDVLVEIGRYVGKSDFIYPDKKIRLHAYQVELISGDFTLSVHDRIKWVKIDNLPQVDLADADIEIALILQEENGGK